jgi:flagellum-specific peptidoglycan hydrolase FlgJ
MDNVNGGYVKVGSGGKEVKYSWKNWLRRWEVEGSGTGWFMTFRPVQQTRPAAAKTQPITTFENSWTGVKAAATAAGSKHPSVVAAQWALESGYGKHTSGKHNFFGIKGTEGQGTLKRTTEFVGGMEIKTDAWFKDYSSLFECVQDLVNKWYRDYKNYKGVNRASSPEECARLLVVEKYATDPAYADKLIRILREHD